MGASTSSQPQNYDLNKTHENDYMATYRHQCSKCDSVPIPGGTLQIGAKVIQAIDDRPGEYYVIQMGTGMPTLPRNWNMQMDLVLVLH